MMPSFVASDGDRVLDQRGFGPVEVAHEGLQAAFVVQVDRPSFRLTLVGQDDTHAGVQKRQLTQPVFQRGEVELDIGEGLGRRAGR